MNLQHSHCIQCVAMILIATTLHASPIKINSGLASIHQTSHQHLFTQQVQMDDEYQHLRAEWVQVTTDDHNQLLSAIARGDSTARAHVWSTEKTPILHAYANEIQYFPREHRVVLIGNAHLSEGENSFSAPKISYNTLTQHIISEAQGHERTTIILSQDHEHLIR